jgi:drug/metabolite transporter (DMT)-like permease
MAKQGTLYLTLLVATFAVSWASILIKLTGAGPLPTAFYRMALASLILTIPAWPKMRRSLHTLTRKEGLLLLFSGLALGFHFATWVTSLFYTTISNSVLIVATQPVFVLVMEAIFLKQKIKARAVIGMIIAVLGIAVISQGDFDLGREFMIGDILALMGAIFAAVYLLIGRRLRANLDNLSYIFPVYSIAAIVLLIMSLFSHENLTNYSANTWLIFLLLALVPTIIGHTLYNWLLKYVPAHMVAMTILGEPIGATLLAIPFFNQIPGWWTIIGGLMILSGIFIVLRRRAKREYSP